MEGRASPDPCSLGSSPDPRTLLPGSSPDPPHPAPQGPALTLAPCSLGSSPDPRSLGSLGSSPDACSLQAQTTSSFAANTLLSLAEVSGGAGNGGEAEGEVPAEVPVGPAPALAQQLLDILWSCYTGTSCVVHCSTWRIMCSTLQCMTCHV